MLVGLKVSRVWALSSSVALDAWMLAFVEKKQIDETPTSKGLWVQAVWGKSRPLLAA